MKQSTDNLERLISRYLDDECTSAERRELKGCLRHDPESAALFEEHAAIDREVNHALRRAMNRPLVGRRVLPMWERAARVIGVAAAACVALMLWQGPGDNTQPSRASSTPQAASWFAPPPASGDMFVPETARFERPQLKVGGSDSEWIVVPSGKPGEFMVIEVKRVLTQTVHIHQDF